MSIKAYGEQDKYYMEPENLFKSMESLLLCNTKEISKIFVSMEREDY